MASTCPVCGAPEVWGDADCGRCGAPRPAVETKAAPNRNSTWLWIVGIAAIANLADVVMSVANSGKIPARGLPSMVR